MRSRFASLLIFGVLVSMSLSAQTRISGTLSCTKPDPMHSIPTDDGSGTIMNLVRVPCTWSKPVDMAGSPSKDGYSVAASEVHGGQTKEHGIHVGTMASGDKYYVHFQGSGTINADHSGTVNGTWTFEGGTGKLKGLTGKGTYKATAKADGSSTAEIQGDYKTP
jgi:hypothetical protein